MSRTNRNETIPIYKATNSLKVNYVFQNDGDLYNQIILNGSKNHAKLYQAYKGLLDKRTGLYPNSDVDTINFATATISLLYSEDPPDSGGLKDKIQKSKFDILAPNQNGNRIVSCLDLYQDEYTQPKVSFNKAKRSETFNTTLKQRLESFEPIVKNYSLPRNLCASQDEVNEKIKSAMFHEYFHHSEQGILYYLSSKLGIKQLVKFARDSNAAYVYGLVCDVYSTRILCGNCNISFIGIQNSQNLGFVHDFNKALENQNIEPRQNGNTMFSTRASISKAGKGQSLEPFNLPDDKDKCHQYNPDINNCVFQAKSANLNRSALIRKHDYNLDFSLSNYKGSFFVSKSFPKVKLESELAKLTPTR